MRIDKFLKVSRILKRRTVAQEAAQAGKISVNGKEVKPAYRVKVGDVVEFTGSKHYVSATATSASSCKPGKAKVTALAKGKAHPYHLIAVSGGGSTVYGWADAADIKTSGAGGATTASYTVKVTVTELRIRSGPGTDTQAQGFIEPGVYTIVEEADGPGAKRWGKLKSGAGWISLDYAEKV